MTRETAENKWVRQIVDLQHEDGSWGFFHSLSRPVKETPITTEQALRRLKLLGLTKADEPIKRALVYLEKCLCRKLQIPDRREKLHDWDIFTGLMLSVWIREFDPENKAALRTANQWAEVITTAFATGVYSPEHYVRAYQKQFFLRPKGGRLTDFVSFYPVSLLRGVLPSKIESAMLDYILPHSTGIYYVYESPLNTPPEMFASLKASRYLAALEALSEYSLAPQKLGFAAEWIKAHQNQDGQWDMGGEAKDNIHFPLSDSWRKPEDRKRDCSARIGKLLQRIER